jgi:hypothetical protein
MTASRKVRVLDVPVEEAMTLARQGMPIPEHMGNSLYLEWFSVTNGRVLIESVGYKLTVSAPEWTLSMEEEQEQAEDNQKAICEWFNQLGEASSEGFPPPGGGPTA